MSLFLDTNIYFKFSLVSLVFLSVLSPLESWEHFPAGFHQRLNRTLSVCRDVLRIRYSTCVSCTLAALYSAALWNAAKCEYDHIWRWFGIKTGAFRIFTFFSHIQLQSNQQGQTLTPARERTRSAESWSLHREYNGRRNLTNSCSTLGETLPQAQVTAHDEWSLTSLHRPAPSAGPGYVPQVPMYCICTTRKVMTKVISVHAYNLVHMSIWKWCTFIL